MILDLVRLAEIVCNGNEHVSPLSVRVYDLGSLGGL